MNAELERRVSERTRQLQERNEHLTSLMETFIALNEVLDRILVQTDKQAALGKMVSVIAHKINNPIQMVKNTFYLLEDQILPGSPAIEYLKMASTEANCISDLVAQLHGTYAS